jgi:Xaa-Pro aminopeptidase
MTGRADGLVELLRDETLDALVVTNLVNVRYLTGFTGTNGLCVVGDEMRSFLTDFRYVEQAERQVRGFESVRGKSDLVAEACERLEANGLRRVGFEDHDLTVHRHGRFRDRLDDEIELVPAGQLVEQLREVKDEDELRAIRAAADLATEVLEELREEGFNGRSEREVKGDLERAMRARGAEPSFDTIVAGGPNGALPHATAGDAAIEPGSLVVVDLGCLLDGYCSDFTRTLAVGELGEDAASVYDLVLGAQRRALAAVTDGAACREVDAVARDMIAEAGHGEEFGHGLGHGVGLEVHEGPRLTQSAKESDRLRARSVVTVEPGVYVPGRFGVRIEDLVVVGEEGPEVLTPFPKEIVTLEA